MRIVSTTYLPREGFARLHEHDLWLPAMPYASKEELRTQLINADVLISTFDFAVGSELLQMAPQLKLIANFGVGFNNIDLDYAREHGITVTNTPGPVIEPTAEHTLALMFTLAHRTAELDRKMRQTDDVRFGVMNNLGVSLYGKTLGIIGMGNIGQSLAKRAVACGMTIIYHNRHRLPEAIEKQYGAQYVSQDELLQTADFVSLNLPYTPQTHYLIGEKELAMMKPTALLINTARGAHVSEKALINALRNGTIAGAALDVYEHEPQISPELKTLDNVVLSPHIGTGTIDGRLDMCECVTDNILAFAADQRERMNIVL